MFKITKKEFIKLHSNNKLELRGSYHKKSKEEIISRLKEFEGTLPVYPVSKASVKSIGDYCITDIYKSDNYILVESVIDFSKCNNCSWDNVQKDIVLYTIK